MLKLSFLLIYLFAAMTQASPILSPTENENIFLSEIVDCGGVAQSDLFRRARLWAAQAHPDGKMLVSDKEAGDLVVQGITSVSIPRSESTSGGTYQFRYALVIECANRKYRASVQNVELLDAGSSKFTSIRNVQLKSEKDMQIFHRELNSKFSKMLGELSQNVKDYAEF
jgi:hypothetical protein